MQQQTRKVIGGILLVAGTTIGAAMLALPASTGLCGYAPSLFLFFLTWLVMTYSAFLLLEVNLWDRRGGNIITMASHTLGTFGKVVSWITYLFLLYALTTSYIAGSVPILVDFLHYLTGYQIPDWGGALSLFFIVAFFVYGGTKYVDRMNRIMMLGLVLAFTSLVFFSFPSVDQELLAHVDLKHAYSAISVIFTSFGFHIIIPTLSVYLHWNRQLLRRVIWIGSAIPLVVYVVWITVTLGVIPIEGEFGIHAAYEKGYNGAKLLTEVLNAPWIVVAGRFLSFFAIVTSFLGVSLSLSDFLADGLKVKKNDRGRLLLCFLTFIPPLLITLTDPRSFLTALEYAGAFGVVMILVIIPALMAWSGRYRKGIKAEYRTPGGKPALVIVVLLGLVVIGLELLNKIGYLEKWIG